MKFSFFKSRIWGRLAFAGVLVSGFSQSSHGQLSTLKKVVESSESTKSLPSESPEVIRTRVEQWNQEARDGLAKLEIPTAAATLPVGISNAELDERRRGLEGMILITAQWLKNITAAETLRKTAETPRAEDAPWSGFKELPPYSILMVDELLNDRDAIQARLTSQESSLSNYERLLASLMDEIKVAEDATSVKIVEAQKSAETTADAAKWRLEAARAKSRQLVARSGLFRSNCVNLKSRITTTRSELLLAERKIKIATASIRFNDEDFSRLKTISEERKQANQKESEAIAKRLKAAKIPSIQAQTALNELIAAASAGQQPVGFELAKFRSEVTQSRVDALQAISGWLEGLPQLENLTLEAYQTRRAILNASDSQARLDSLESLIRLLDRIQAWENVLDSEITSSEADLRQLESRAELITSDDPRFSLVNEQRAIHSEKFTMIQRVAQAVTSQRKLLKRWIEEYSPKPGQQSVGSRLNSLGTRTSDILKNTWSFEVLSFEDKIIVDGQTIIGNIPVTLGMLLRALLFFIIGYGITSHISYRIQRSLVTRGHIAEAQAKTLRNWLMIVVGIFLAIGTLSFLKIPLTVFAFFGGALAIGLGFGMQTLIKNFISGIIVLFERKIRVGDIVDVGGLTGSVTEINTRSSVLRGGDGKETLVPNSYFLENRVTNLTLSNRRVRRSFTIRVALDSSPQAVNAILKECLERHGLILKEPLPITTFEDFVENAYLFGVYYWTEFNDKTNADVVASDLRFMIEKRFAEAGIKFSKSQPEAPLPMNLNAADE